MNSLSRRRTLKTLFCSSAALALNLQSRSAQAEVSKNGLHFLAIGDFGTGAADQKAVAKAMQDFAKNSSLKPEALFMIGDNFYGPTKEGFTTESKRRLETGDRGNVSSRQLSRPHVCRAGKSRLP